MEQGIKVVESNQFAECFDCGEMRPIYAIQDLIHSEGGIVTTGFFIRGATCRECYEELHDLEQQELEQAWHEAT